MPKPPRSQRITRYMRCALAHLAALPPGARILDIPAGHGQLTDALRELGYAVTPADINRERSDYVFADMSRRLPFPDHAFDAVVCLEGVEHMLNPFQLVGELIRVAKPGGHIVISTPNIMNMYSRLQFLFTGTFHQFAPAALEDVAPGEVRDRFHVAPMSYHTLRYLGEYFGARVIKLDVDKVKRRVLMPLYLPIIWLGKLWSRRLFFSRKYEAYRDRNREIYRHINSRPVLFSRSLILVFEKRQTNESAAESSGILSTAAAQTGPAAPSVPAATKRTFRKRDRTRCVCTP